MEVLRPLSINLTPSEFIYFNIVSPGHASQWPINVKLQFQKQNKQIPHAPSFEDEGPFKLAVQVYFNAAGGESPPSISPSVPRESTKKGKRGRPLNESIHSVSAPV